MTTETREALRDFASAVKWLSESTVSIATRADRLIRALELEAADPGGWQLASTVKPLRRPTVNLISAVKLAVLENGGFAHHKELCQCHPELEGPCRYCAIHDGLTKAFTFLQALEQKEGGSLPCGKCGGSGVVDSGGVTPWGAAIDLPCPACNSKWDALTILGASWQKDSSLEKWFPMTAEELARLKVEVEQLKRERTVAAIASDYETWRDEQLDTLRKLFRQRGQQYYQSFPDFCRDQWEGSDKGKVKI